MSYTTNVMVKSWKYCRKETFAVEIAVCIILKINTQKAPIIASFVL